MSISFVCGHDPAGRRLRCAFRARDSAPAPDYDHDHVARADSPSFCMHSGTLRWVPGYAHEGQAKAVRELLGHGRSMLMIHSKVRVICDTIFPEPASSDLLFTPPSPLVARPQHIADCRLSMWGNGVAFGPTCVGRLLGFRAPRTVPSIHTGAGVPYVSAGGCTPTTPLSRLAAVSCRLILHAIRTSGNRTFAPTLPLEHRLRI